VSRLLEVGRVVRAHGLRGQVVLELWTNRAERVAAGSRLFGPSGELSVVRSSPASPAGGRKRCVVAFEGIHTREEAETLRDAVLRAQPLQDDSAVWVHDLVGSEVYTTGGEMIGRVDCVEVNPASDLLVLEDGKLVPLTFVTTSAPGRLTVEVPEGLLEL
jgi:16S rRNA processing protein RimM